MRNYRIVNEASCVNISINTVNFLLETSNYVLLLIIIFNYLNFSVSNVIIVARMRKSLNACLTS
jgi:hypothetical protein